MEERCKNCLYWAELEDPVGICSMGSNGHESLMVARHVDHYDDGTLEVLTQTVGWLQTDAEFSCQSWECDAIYD